SLVCVFLIGQIFLFAAAVIFLFHGFRRQFIDNFINSFTLSFFISLLTETILPFPLPKKIFFFRRKKRKKTYSKCFCRQFEGFIEYTLGFKDKGVPPFTECGQHAHL